MSALSDYSENLLNKFLLTGQAATRPTQWHIALFTSATTDGGGGTEVSGSGYARGSVTFNVTGDTASNVADVSFTATGGNYGTVTHMAVVDSASGGNFLWHGPLNASRAVNDGDTLVFTAGDIDLTLA